MSDSRRHLKGLIAKLLLLSLGLYGSHVVANRKA